MPGSFAHTHARTRAHTHTHTRIYTQVLLDNFMSGEFPLPPHRAAIVFPEPCAVWFGRRIGSRAPSESAAEHRVDAAAATYAVPCLRSRAVRVHVHGGRANVHAQLTRSSRTGPTGSRATRTRGVPRAGRSAAQSACFEMNSRTVSSSVSFITHGRRRREACPGSGALQRKAGWAWSRPTAQRKHNGARRCRTELVAGSCRRGRDGVVKGSRRGRGEVLSGS